ncbi:MAG: SLBB domain-containing protein, partial [Muribaculaceae bacterium]|nr:SLBB domain-containing protein [Muribaculaceae bacterium]
MNIRKYLFIGLMALALSAGAMTDDEVIRYIRTQSANGKTEKQIGQELMARGVKPDQVRRIKAKYQREGSMGTGTDNSAQTAAVQYQGENYQMNRNQGVQTNRNQANQTQTGDLRTVGDDSGMVNEPDYIDAFPTTTKEVYGHSLFNLQSLSFEPNNNMATPKNYRLGPGDEVIIDIWGAAEEHLREKISPEGSIMVSRLGPVYLNGKTVDEANKYIKNLFANKYGGLSNEQTDVSVNLGDIRSIQIDIMGEVSTPGSFRMSPFSSVFHALYNAGGINDIGSMRNIYVLRNGKRVATVDIYDYLFKGKQTGNIRLQEGDVIIVPPYEQIVNVSGNVKRPMYYEIKPGETVASLLDYAGGLSGDAYSGMVQLSRQNGTENELYNVEKGDFDSYRLKDGDVVTVGTVLDRFSNRVELKGAVTRPGLYALGSGATTLTEMLRLAEGLTDDAYKGRALIYRQGPDMTFEVIPVNLGSVMAGISPDITLQKNDIVEIASVQDISEKGDFTINGMVTNPGAYSYMANTSVEDLILRAGGLREGASTARVDVSRRIVDPAAMTETNQLAQTYTITIVGGL